MVGWSALPNEIMQPHFLHSIPFPQCSTLFPFILSIVICPFPLVLLPLRSTDCLSFYVIPFCICAIRLVIDYLISLPFLRCSDRVSLCPYSLLGFPSPLLYGLIFAFSAEIFLSVLYWKEFYNANTCSKKFQKGVDNGFVAVLFYSHKGNGFVVREKGGRRK